jgi:nucleotide-binding universal stress UspA family protein
MVLLVPFDGSELATAALRRATEFAELTDEPLVVLSVVTDDERFARERGWVGEDEPYDPDAIAERLETSAREVAPDATFRREVPTDAGEMAATPLDVARTIRQVAHEIDASIVFVGSENAGRVSTPITSVGSPVSEDPGYDVHIVRHASSTHD